MQDKDYLVLQRGAETKQKLWRVSCIFFVLAGKYYDSTAKLAVADSFHTFPNSLLTQPRFRHYNTRCQKGITK